LTDFKLPSDGSPHVTVIGAGIVGVTAALELSKAGCAVRIVDRLPPGEGCSHGNAGIFASASAEPLANPKTLLKVPGWLFSPEGPLHIRMRYLPRLLPWLLRFGWNGMFGDHDRATAAMHELVATSPDDYEQLAREAGVSDLIRRNGWVYVYNTEAERDEHQAELIVERERGFDFVGLDKAGLQDLLPGISSHYIGGDHVPKVGHTTNPGRLTKALAELVRKRGGEIVEASVERLEREGGKVTALATDRGRMPVDRLVIAAGAFSARLTGQIGDPLPLETERGYHVIVESGRISHETPVMDSSLGAVVTPMEMGVRAAGTVELASLDAPENPVRARNLLRMAKRMYPDLDTSRYETWMGRRPTLPDSVAVIDRASEVGNVFYAFGHQHVGLTGAPATARLVRQLVEGRTPNIDMSPYSARRFR